MKINMDNQLPQFNSIQLSLMISALNQYKENFKDTDPYREVIRHLIKKFKSELLKP